jgi:hypothetical protein
VVTVKEAGCGSLSSGIVALADKLPMLIVAAIVRAATIAEIFLIFIKIISPFQCIAILLKTRQWSEVILRSGLI